MYSSRLLYQICIETSGDGIGVPRPPHVSFELFLSALDPGQVVPLRDFDARMAEQDRHPINRHTSLKQLHSVRVPEPMRVRPIFLRESGKLEELP